MENTNTQQYRTNDLTGKQFGMLTVIEPTAGRYYSSIVWRCRCSCGNEVLRAASQLRAGVRLNCGCAKCKAGERLEERAARTAGTAAKSRTAIRIRSESTTGVRGVTRFKDRYRAKIFFQGQNYSLGVYQTIDEAAAVRKEAEDCLFGNFLDFYDRWKRKAEEDPEWGKENPVSVSVKKDATGRSHVSIKPDLDGTEEARKQAEPVVSDYCAGWLEKQKEKVLPATLRRYRSVINRHVMPAIGTCRPSELTKDRLDRMMEEAARTLSAGSLLSVRGVLRALLEYIEQNAPGQLPDLTITCPQYVKAKLSLEKQITILEALTGNMDTIKLGVFLALMTGMTVGEICALRWKDIIFIWHQIKIENSYSLVETDGKMLPKMEPAKRKPEEQVLPMTRFTAEYCKKFYRSENKERYVMTGTEEPMPPWTVNYRFRKLMKSCGLPDVHFDDLHDGFPEADVDMDFDDERLNEVLKNNLKKV